MPQQNKSKSPLHTLKRKTAKYKKVLIPLNQILCGDALKKLKQLPSNSIDLVVTSPPYNIKNSTGNGLKDGRGGKWSKAALLNGYSHYNDCMPHDEYDRWQKQILKECLRVIKDDGAIFYNHKWRVQSGLIQDRRNIVNEMPVRQIIIWKRKGGINFNRGYFLPTYEVIYMICKNKFQLAERKNGVGDVWEFSQDFKNPHPAPFPIELVLRIISSTNAKIILDPFMGSGTTAIAAKTLGRNYIGFDISPQYCEMAKSRIAKFSKNEKVKSDRAYKKSSKRLKLETQIPIKNNYADN